MESTTTKRRRPRVKTGVLITSTNHKTRNTIAFLERLDIKVISHFKALSYSTYGYKFTNI